MAPNDPPDNKYNTQPRAPDPDRLTDQLLDIAEKQPEELTYSPDLEDITIDQFEGANDLTENDRRIVERLLRHAIQRKRQKYGYQVEGAEEG